MVAVTEPSNHRCLLWCLALLGLVIRLPIHADESSTSDRPVFLMVVGAAGEPGFGDQFTNWAKRVQTNCNAAKVDLITLGLDEPGQSSDKEQLRHHLEETEKSGLTPLWILFLGHGTFDRAGAKFNLRGPDVAPEELQSWLAPFKRPIALINASSSSGPFLNALSANGRVIVTATKSGQEHNFSRFGNYFTQALGSPEADRDKDDQTSLLEAYLMAARGVADFYEAEGRLATEHALIDDNGDGLGTPASWFRGVRAVKKARDQATVDGIRAHQLHLIPSEREQRMSPETRAQRDQLERDILLLRDAKPDMDEKEYYAKLEVLLLQMARLYESVDTPDNDPPETPKSPDPE